MMKRIRKSVKTTLISIGVVALAFHYHWYTNDLSERQKADVIVDKTIELQTLRIDTTDIIITNYYHGDGSSGTVTASGKKISDFEVNEQGYYTYEGYVVIATANTTRLKWELKDGFRSHELYEILNIEIDGQHYPAIVLDVCGACYQINGETNQRYDIFTIGNVIGKVEGKLHEVSIQN
jgi:hypothetical protein